MKFTSIMPEDDHENDPLLTEARHLLVNNPLKGSRALAILSVAGNHQASYYLGLYWHTSGFPGKAHEYLTLAADGLTESSSQQAAHAMHLLGKMYEGGHGITACTRQAAIWYSRAADLRFKPAYPDAARLESNPALAAMWKAMANPFNLMPQALPI